MPFSNYRPTPQQLFIVSEDRTMCERTLTNVQLFSATGGRLKIRSLHSSALHAPASGSSPGTCKRRAHFKAMMRERKTDNDVRPGVGLRRSGTSRYSVSTAISFRGSLSELLSKSIRSVTLSSVYAHSARDRGVLGSGSGSQDPDRATRRGRLRAPRFARA